MRLNSKAHLGWYAGMVLTWCLLCICCSSRHSNDLNGRRVGYRVGYAVHHVYDSTRTYPAPDSLNLSNNFRPMQISVWYPAKKDKSLVMRYKEYLYSILTEEYFRKLNRFEKQRIVSEFKNSAAQVFGTSGSNEIFLDSLLSSETIAFKDAHAVEGSFPLVIYAPGNDPGGTYGSSMENSLLFERLASQGFVVASVPAYRGRKFTEVDDEVHSQAKDQEFLLNWMKSASYVDTTKIASMAYSFGGVGQIIHAHDNANIKAIISIESGITFKEMYERLHTYEQYQNILPESFEQPFLHFASAPLWKGNWNMTLNQEFFERSPSESYLVRFLDAGHRDMASDQVYTVALAHNDGDSVPVTKEYPIVNRQKSLQAYMAMCEVTLGFLETQFGVLQKDPNSADLGKEWSSVIEIDTFYGEQHQLKYKIPK